MTADEARQKLAEVLCSQHEFGCDEARLIIETLWFALEANGSLITALVDQASPALLEALGGQTLDSVQATGGVEIDPAWIFPEGGD